MMTKEQITFFNNNKVKIQDTFEKYKSTNNFFGVYFDLQGKLFMTFRKSNDFSSTMRISKSNYTLVLIIDCSKSFEKQIDIL
jgi:hypothetical protein